MEPLAGLEYLCFRGMRAMAVTYTIHALVAVAVAEVGGMVLVYDVGEVLEGVCAVGC